MGMSRLVLASRGLAVFVALMWCTFSAVLALQISGGKTVTTTGSPSTALLACSIALAAITVFAWASIALARRNWTPALCGLVVAFMTATVINAMFEARTPRTFTPSVAEGVIAAVVAFAVGAALVWQAFIRDKASPVVAAEAVK